MDRLPKNAETPRSPQEEVADRFGVLPNFFRLAPEAPEVTENLWGFAKFAYLDNPLPSLFKERLFVYLSQFCEVRYCIARHVGFLVGLGRPSGDRQCSPETIEQIVQLLRRPFPEGEALQAHLEFLTALAAPLSEMPQAESRAEESLFACASHVFRQTPMAAKSLAALSQALEPAALQHLLVFLGFVRTAHYWTQVHPELRVEDDITELLEIHESLAQCVLHDPQEGNSQTEQVLLSELAELRKEREQAELLRVTLASIGDAVIVTDPQSRITMLNGIAEELTGWTESDAQGQPLNAVFKIINEQTRDQVESPAEKALRQGVVVGLANHTLLIARDGTERPIDHSAAPIRSSDGVVLGCVLVFRDVTRRRRLERENAEREKNAQFLAALVASSQDAIVSKTLDGIIQSWNAGAERIFGYTAEEAIGQHILMLIPPERTAEEDRIIAQLKAGQRVEHYDTIRVRRDGQRIPVSLTISPIKDAAGRIIGASKIARDISDRKLHEAALAKSEERYRLALEGADLGAWNIDPATNHLTSDERFRVIFHGSTQPLTYEQAFAAIHPDDRRRIRDAVAAATQPEAPTPYAEEYRVVHPDGSIRWVLGRGRASFSSPEEGGRVTSFDGTIMDITQPRQLRDELRETAAQLSEADRRKDEFLATLAHELRNPLAPIRTGLDVLAEAGNDDQVRDEICQTMQRQVEQMVHLVDDLLDVSRITRGTLQLRRQHIPVADAVHSAVEATRVMMEEAGHELTVTLPDEPIMVYADPTRLAQVLTNLLHNAVKYTPTPGNVWLEVERQRQDKSQLEVRVRDTGMGIPPEMGEHIFEMFGQIDRSLETGYSGLGIGLTLVKNIVHMHGGAIELHSEGAGQGSEFTVRLPIPADPSASTPDSETSTAAEQHQQGLRVLVVDDNEAAAIMLRMLVQAAGHQVRTAGDGEEAVQCAADFLPDVVLMDIGMPKMNGYEAAQHIRRQPWGQDMVLAALTGWGQEEDRQKTKDAGFDYHLVKPADSANLKELLASVVSQRG